MRPGPALPLARLARALAATLVVVVVGGAAAACSSAPVQRQPEPPLTLVPAAFVAPAPAPPRFLKGQLHAHTNRSGDSNTPPDVVRAFYVERGYDFVVFTDHNWITEPPPPAEGDEMLVIPGVELTMSLMHCEDPPPEPGKKCLPHMNALFVTAPPSTEKLTWGKRPSRRRIDLYQTEIDRARQLGGIPMLNHPNFHWTCNPALAAELGRRGVVLMEVANQGMWSNKGDARHPSTEKMWDLVLTEGVTMWGVATDDAHHYLERDIRYVQSLGKTTYPADRGWVMVRAPKEPAAIRDALLRGDFYSSNGVTLRDVRVDDGHLVVEVAPDEHAALGSKRSAGRRPPTIRFIGAGGALLAETQGTEARFPLAEAAGGYVRAVVEDAAGKKAWVQPVRVPPGGP